MFAIEHWRAMCRGNRCCPKAFLAALFLHTIKFASRRRRSGRLLGMRSSPSLASLFLIVLLVAVAVAALSVTPGEHVAQGPLQSRLWLAR